MSIWVDADACPTVIRQIVFRAAERTGVRATFVANRLLSLPPSAHVSAVQVQQGADVADHHILAATQSHDLVITADIPLAAEVIAKGAQALSPRGELFHADNIRELLNMRDFMDTLRGSGVHTGGPAPFSQSDAQAFANQLDRWLTRRRRG